MNRRRFLTTTATALALASTTFTNAREIGLVEGLVSNVFGYFPDNPGLDGFAFPVTSGTVGMIQREVWPENPDMYWDPEGEDYESMLGFHPKQMQLGAGQEGASLWFMDPQLFDREMTRQTLESNGWQIIDDDLLLLYYAGSEDDRSNLAASLNLLGNRMRDGEWDWIALAHEGSLVMGSDGERVKAIADRLVNGTSGSSIGDRVEPLKPLIRTDTYLISILPPERLPMESVEVSFVSRSWTGDLPIIHSIGMQLGTGEQVEQLVESVQARLTSETSTQLRTTYADFLELSNIQRNSGSVRFDFVSTTDRWDVFDALEVDDLGMLPLIDNVR